MEKDKIKLKQMENEVKLKDLEKDERQAELENQMEERLETKKRKENKKMNWIKAGINCNEGKDRDEANKHWNGKGDNNTKV